MSDKILIRNRAFTKLESLILCLLKIGMTDNEIALFLNKNRKNVEIIINNITSNFNASSRNEIVRYAFKEPSSLRHLLANISVGSLIINQYGKIVFVNSKFMTQSERANGELINMDIREIIFKEDYNKITNLLSNIHTQYLNNAVNENRVNRFKFRIVRKSENLAIMNALCTLISEDSQPVLILLTQDLTEQTLLSVMAGNSSTINYLSGEPVETKAINSPSAIGICYLNHEGQIVFVNNFLAARTGYDVSEVINKPWRDLVDGKDKENIERFIESSAACFEVEFKLKNKFDKKIYFMASFVKCKENANFIDGYVGLLFDVTKIKESERKIAGYQRLTASLDTLAHVSRFETAESLAVTLAHQIKQPLTSINQYLEGCIQRLMKVNIEADLIEKLRSIGTLVDNIGNLINHMKQFIRKGIPVKTEICVRELIDNVLLLVEHKLKEENVEFTTELDESLSIYVDKIQMQQVLINLINNAIEAMRGYANNKLIKIVCELEDSDKKTTNIEVINTGIPINKDNRDKIFEPFFTTKEDGLGIGLAIVKSIIEKHNGYIGLANDEEDITKFVIKLPLYGYACPYSIKSVKQELNEI